MGNGLSGLGVSVGPMKLDMLAARSVAFLAGDAELKRLGTILIGRARDVFKPRSMTLKATGLRITTAMILRVRIEWCLPPSVVGMQPRDGEFNQLVSVAPAEIDFI